ncbi:MAG: murein biosynthesis integral membrane protein MurJ [Panacagrimonas sp.]
MSSSRLLKSTGIVGLMTLLSRVLGFVRDILFAAAFGAGPAMDVFLLALKIPNFGRRVFAEGALSQAFVPVFTEVKAKGTHEEVRQLFDVVAGTLGTVLAVVTLVGCLGAPLLVWIFAPGIASDPVRHDLAAELLRWTFPYLMLISLTALGGGVLNTYGRFAVPAITPVILNLCLIGTVFIDANSVRVLAVAVFVAGIIQLLFQLPWLARVGLWPRPRWGGSDERVRRIVRLMAPIVFGSSVAQISLLLDTVIASLLFAGSLSWLYYADRLMEFPLGIFSIAVATVVLPSLAAQHVAQSTERFSATLDWALRVMLLLGVPATAALILLAGPLVSTLFLHGEFSVHDLDMTRWALMAYAFAFLGISLVKVLIPAFYARQQTAVPMRYGIVSLVAGMATSVSLVGLCLWQHLPAPHVAVASATSASSLLNAGLLYRRLRRDGIFNPRPGWGRYFVQLGLAVGVMSALLWFGAGPLQGWTEATLHARVLRLASLIGAAAATYFALLWLAGVRLSVFRMQA